jgi:transient-receptor-potential-like protein
MTDNPKNSFFLILHRSQVGHCNSRESFKRQQNLQKAISQARKLLKKTPTLGTNKGTSSVTASSLMRLLNDVTEETDQCSDQNSKNPVTEGELQGSLFSVITTTEQI